MENNAQMYVDLGEVLCAKRMFLHNRAKVREQIKSSLSSLDQAKKSYSMFGMYDDCGPSYESDLIEARAQYNNAMCNRETFVVSSEKFFKKLKHQFLEKYPTFDWMLNEKLEAANKEYIKEQNGKTSSSS